MTTTEMPAASVANLLGSKGGDAWVRTIRKAIVAARRDGIDYFVGFTALAYYIETSDCGGLRFIARADGRVEKVA
jgi:hypothetical protein